MEHKECEEAEKLILLLIQSHTACFSLNEIPSNPHLEMKY